jgi:hypothetical protein
LKREAVDVDARVPAVEQLDVVALEGGALLAAARVDLADDDVGGQNHLRARRHGRTDETDKKGDGRDRGGR